jgi:hypothetical protein
MLKKKCSLTSFQLKQKENIFFPQQLKYEKYLKNVKKFRP